MSEDIQPLRLWQLIKGRTYYCDREECEVIALDNPSSMLPFDDGAPPEGYDIRVRKNGRVKCLTDFASLPADQQLSFYEL